MRHARIYKISEPRAIDGIYDTTQILSMIHHFLVLNAWKVTDITQTSLRGVGASRHVSWKPKIVATATNDLKYNRTIIKIKSYASLQIGALTRFGSIRTALHARKHAYLIFSS
jgi:hypothetical protein